MLMMRKNSTAANGSQATGGLGSSGDLSMQIQGRLVTLAQTHDAAIVDQMRKRVVELDAGPQRQRPDGEQCQHGPREEEHESTRTGTNRHEQTRRRRSSC